MNGHYKIIGDDGREYAGVSAEQIKQWIVEGRVERRTPIFAEGAKDWNFVGLLPEFSGCFTGSAPPPIAPPVPGASSAGQMPKTNSFAIAGLVCGILSVTLCLCCGGFPLNILGLVFSVVALAQTGESPQLHAGRSLAIAGLILSTLGLVIFLMALASGHAHLTINTGGL